MLILVDLVSRHIYEEFDGNLVKMIFTLTYDEPDFEPAADCEILHKPAVAISTVVADYIVQHDPENLTDDDKLSLKILYGENKSWISQFVLIPVPNFRLHSLPH